jgi:hypothetical protein
MPRTIDSLVPLHKPNLRPRASTNTVMYGVFPSGRKPMGRMLHQSVRLGCARDAAAGALHLQAILFTARAGEEMQLVENRKNLLLCVLDGVDGNGIELVLPKRFPLKPFPLYLDFLDQFQVGCTWNGSVISLARFCTTWIVATNLT